MIDESARWRIIARATPALRFVEGRVLLAVHRAAVETGTEEPVLTIEELREGVGSSRRMLHYAIKSLRERRLLSTIRAPVAEHARPRRYSIQWTQLAEHAREGVL